MENGGEYDGRGNLTNRLSALAVTGRNDSNGNNYNLGSALNQGDDVLVKIRDQEPEIMQLRKRLAEYSAKEAQMRSEKYILEERVALMRMAFDQQQQDIIDATSRAISYRQDIIEENIRLSYALEGAQEETSTFASSLMPLLAEFSLHPPVADAQSIVRNLRVLFTHFKERLTLTEAKLRESQYRLAPWHSDMDPSNSAQLPERDDPDSEERKNEKESLVNSPYSNVTHSNYAPSPVVGQQKEEPLVNPPYLPYSNMTHSNYAPSPVVGQQKEEPLVNPPYLPSILEEPSSPFPEPDDEEEEDDHDDESLPAIEGLQILGEAFPGHELQASGYSTNGTTHCGFEWVRHLEDGSVNYINGATQPTYIVTADDVDIYLAVEVQPLDDNQRKGELVKCFANKHRKISCAPEMRHHIEKTLNAGQGYYGSSLWAGSLDIWELVTLEIKREGYSIKRGGHNDVVVAEKFSEATVVSIPSEIPQEFSIIGSGGVEHFLRAKHSSTDISCSRDTIVLTMRLFINRAVERKKKKKKKKRVLFFTK